MIRILFTIVAVVAAVLAVIIQQPLLFVAAGLSLAVSIVLVVVRLQRRRSTYRQSGPPKPEPEPESGDDLASLGILEIRPRGKAAEPRPEPAEASETALVDAPESLTEARAEPEPAGAPRPESARTNGAHEPARIQSTFTIKEKAQIVRASVEESAPEYIRDVLVPYLQACRAALEANTVCLLKQPDETPHYHIEAIVSLNAYARSGGTFSAKNTLLDRHDMHAPPITRRVSDGSLSAHSLGYYRETIAVKEVAVTMVPHPTAASNYVLLADAMQENLLDSDRKLALLTHFARLLGVVLDTGGAEEALAEADDYVRPRREIISEEIERAKKDETPLALALVYLNRAEEIADRGDRAITNAERTLANRLRKSAREARVERFGELTFGVFFKAGGAEVESWAVGLQRDLDEASGVLQGGVSIGIALLHDRHADADSFRRDATDALREAYESGTCTIVE